MSQTKRDSIIFYRSFYEAINELPAEIQPQIYSAIFEYSLNFNEIVLSGLPKTIFKLIKPQLDANNKRFENGKTPKRKSKTEANEKQIRSESEANNNVNKNNNENANENVNNNIPTFSDFLIYAKEKEPSICEKGLKNKYDSWVENNWKDGNNSKINNWKVKLLNTLAYLPKKQILIPEGHYLSKSGEIKRRVS